MREIICDKRRCKKVIGHFTLSGRKTYYEGTNQVGHNSYCSEKHLKSEWERDNKKGIYIKYKTPAPHNH